MNKLFKVVNERVNTRKRAYSVNVFTDGFNVNDSPEVDPEFYLLVSIANNRVEGFIEVNRDDKIICYSGNNLNGIKEHYCIQAVI